MSKRIINRAYTPVTPLSEKNIFQRGSSINVYNYTNKDNEKTKTILRYSKANDDDNNHDTSSDKSSHVPMPTLIYASKSKNDNKHKTNHKSDNKSREKPDQKPKDNSYLSYEKKDDRTSLKFRSYLWDHIETLNPNKHKTSNKTYINNIKNIQAYTKIKNEVKSGTSIVTFLSNSSGDVIVKKEFIYYHKGKGRPFNPSESYENEVNSLKLLYGCKRFPQMLYHDDATFSVYMTYCGEHINKHNTPSDWKSQILKIYDILKEKHIYNNDVYINNFCVKDGLISLIDFGLAKNHIDFCFYNLNKEDIENSRSLEDLNKRIKERASGIYETLYECY